MKMFLAPLQMMHISRSKFVLQECELNNRSQISTANYYNKAIDIKNFFKHFLNSTEET